MGTWPPSLVASLRGRPGLTDIRSAGVPAVAPGGMFSKFPGFPPSGIVSTPEQAEAFVAAQVAHGADYVKIMAETPGPGALDQPTLGALVAAAHRHGKKTVAHATSAAAYQLAQQADADVITHVPSTQPALDADAARRMAGAGRVAVPTLTQMAGLTAHLPIPGLTYDAALASVAVLHAAGVVILAGTDANSAPGLPSPATARACTTSWSGSSTRASPRSRRSAPPPRTPPMPSASPTAVSSSPDGAPTCSWSTATPPAPSAPPGTSSASGSPAPGSAEHPAHHGREQRHDRRRHHRDVSPARRGHAGRWRDEGPCLSGYPNGWSPDRAPSRSRRRWASSWDCSGGHSALLRPQARSPTSART